MSFLTKPRGDRDHQSFKETSQGKVARRVCTDSTDPLHVQIVEATGDDILNEYDEANSVASLATVIIVTYTVPVGKVLNLKEIEFNGCNVAKYWVEVNSTNQAMKTTYFSGDLFGSFNFHGKEFVAGDKIDLKVENFRPTTADFNGRIIGVLV